VICVVAELGGFSSPYVATTQPYLECEVLY
jgi:hypothetical protein